MTLDQQVRAMRWSQIVIAPHGESSATLTCHCMP